MKTGLKILLVAVIVGLFATAGATQGLAGGYGHRHHGHHYGHKQYGHHFGYKRHHYGHKRRHHGDHALGLVLLPFAYLFGYAQGQYDSAPHYGSYRRHARGCHFVTKVGYDEYGRRAKFGGTMCYDSYGEPYIVPGSRHIIHFYY